MDVINAIIGSVKDILDFSEKSLDSADLNVICDEMTKFIHSSGKRREAAINSRLNNDDEGDD